jgi:hypothetical protein
MTRARAALVILDTMTDLARDRRLPARDRRRAANLVAWALGVLGVSVENAIDARSALPKG